MEPQRWGLEDDFCRKPIFEAPHCVSSVLPRVLWWQAHLWYHLRLRWFHGMSLRVPHKGNSSVSVMIVLKTYLKILKTPSEATTFRENLGGVLLEMGGVNVSAWGMYLGQSDGWSTCWMVKRGDHGKPGERWDVENPGSPRKWSTFIVDSP